MFSFEKLDYIRFDLLNLSPCNSRSGPGFSICNRMRFRGFGRFRE